MLGGLLGIFIMFAVLIGGILMCVFAPILIVLVIGGGLALGIFAFIIRIFLAALRFVF